MRIKKAFTMIEVIFVIVIISILASVVIPRLLTARDDSKIASCLSDISTLVEDLTTYYTSQGNFSVNTKEMTNVKNMGSYIGINDSYGVNYTGMLNYVCQDKNKNVAVSFVIHSTIGISNNGYEYSLSIEEGNSSNSLDKQLVEHMKKHNLMGNYKISGLRYKN